MVDISLLLEQPELALRAVHLPRPSAEVRWVATSELEDPSPFLEGGELLLTTGLATHGWRSQWSGYVARLAQAGVSSLALGVGLTHQRAPVALVRACERHDLNLLEVPRQTTFVAVSRAAVRLIEKRDESDARLALDSQRQLTAAAVHDDPTRAVVAQLARIVDGVAFLLAPDGRVGVGPAGPRRELADVEAARAELVRIRPQGLRAASTSSDERGTSLLVPVGLRGRPAYYLALAVPGRVTSPRRSAVTTAVSLLGLTVEQERDRRETRRRLWQKMHQLLARGDVDAALVVGDAATAPVLPSRVQAVLASGPPDLLEDALSDLERDEQLAVVDGGVLRLLASPSRASRAAGTLAERQLAVGVGEPGLLADVATALSTAALALERATPDTGAVHWDRVVRERAVGLLAPEVAAALASSYIEPLEEELVETLGSFLRQNGSRLKVAEELGLHRNTVRHRVHRIEEALGRSLDDPDTRASAWLALQAGSV